ncbi:MAG: CoA ester lyase [candidate division NC10 bacterium]|nr:CoA ester lyase [candidate division NC10 bacterium]
MEAPRHLRRSFLYVPGSEDRKVLKAAGLGADAVILDFEDAVAESQKAAARTLVRAFLPSQPRGQVEWLIRIGGIESPHFDADLRAAVAARPDGVIISKVNRPEALLQAEVRLAEAELAAGRPMGSIRLFAMIESARAVLNAFAIATATPRLAGLLLGHVDLSLEIGITPGPAGHGTILHARCQLVLAARAAGVDVVDCVYLTLRDTEGLRGEAAQAAGLGFTGKQAIHPGQLAGIHEAFTPTPQRVARARRILAAWQQAQAEGKGVIALDGELVEPPVVALEQRILERAGAI